MFGFLGTGYTLTNRNKLCSDNEYSAVSDMRTCEKAAKWLSKEFKEFKENPTNWPKGCFLSGTVYFNPHSTGSRSHDGRQICHAKGMICTNLPFASILGI